MADEATKTISLALYRYMCQNIVGSENHVKTIRLMNTVRDNMKSNKICIMITSGSFGEGLEMRGSDLDLMHVNTMDIEVYEDIITDYKSNVIYLSMKTDDVKAGYTLLQVEQMGLKDQYTFCEKHNGKHYLSGALFKQEFVRYTNGVVHGPCISNKRGTFDNAMCLRCTTWISQASQWITRSSNAWPSYNVKQSIFKHGVLLVPIGVKGSPKEDIEWRFSFSVGEKFLINTFTNTQLICYALLKILLKDVIATYTECEDLLCSYFLKTIIFWISEELPQSIWKPENLIHCFMRCFSRLIYCVEYSVCLHYFIPENNMFENKIEGRAREILLEKLDTLHSYGWRCILFSDQVSNFRVSMWMNDIKPHILFSSEVAKTLNSALLSFTNNIAYTFETGIVYKRGIHQIVSCDQSSLKFLCTYYISLWCAQYAQDIPLNSTERNNKHQYNQYKSCLCTLLQNIYHDAVSGWLMIASFFYKTKQYSKALQITMYSISKCTPEKLYIGMNMSDIHRQLLKLKSYKKKSVVQLWRLMRVDNMRFKENSWVLPNELQMEVKNKACFISSITFAYFLKFVCHYHLNAIRQYQDCLHDLQQLIAENYFVKSINYTILGVALQLSGDHDTARQAFMQSVEFDPDPIYNTSAKRLSLMSKL